MEFDLVQNALHSLSEAINYYHEADETHNEDKYKFCVLLSAHCVELLLKEILRINHPSLVFEDIDKIKQLSNDTDVQTVGYRLAMQRAKNICGTNFLQYENCLIELGQIRNRVQHYKCNIDGVYYKNLMSRSFSAIEYLFLDILHFHFENFTDVIDQNDINFLHEDASVLEARKKDIQKEFQIGNAIKYKIEYDDKHCISLPCPICGTMSLAQENKIRCKMCANEFDDHRALHEKDSACFISDYVLRELGRRKDKLTFPIYECANCENYAVVSIQKNAEGDDWLCLNCGLTFPEIYCDDCGNPMPNAKGIAHVATFYDDINQFKYLCPCCTLEAHKSEEYDKYEID